MINSYTIRIMKPYLVLLFSSTIITFFISCNNDNIESNSTHIENPIQSQENILSEQMTNKIMNSEYYKSLDSLFSLVKGQTVVNSFVGNAGFILVLNNDRWVASYRIDSTVASSFGKGIPSIENQKIINSVLFGDATDPIPEDRIYANEKCDIKAEVEKSHGKTLTGLSIGEKSFNFAFENDFELDFSMVKDKENKPAIRVFWEKW